MAQIIEKLTPEQEAMLPIIAEECLQYGLSTAPTNKEEALKAAKLCYFLAGVKVPADEMFVFLPSPNAGMALANEFEACKTWHLEDGKIITNGGGTAKLRFIPPFYGSHEMGFLSFYIAYQAFGIKCIDQMNGLIAVAKNCGWTWFFDEACIITERPIELRLDESGRLHNLAGMAIRYSDGYGLYAVNGIVVPERIILHPEQMTSKEIDAEPNVELRRIMIDLYGQENYLLNGNAEKLQEDAYGILYRKCIQGDEDLLMVKVTNSTPEPDGSVKNYFLRVPPTIKTAHEAVAWSFTMPQKDYNPLIET